ncbi:MAG: hypothetical protein MRY49_02350 [Candidatus Pacebacteria bacterium]|nr:hypothetical protein [Candidatus Paceibacterota bacterium]
MSQKEEGIDDILGTDYFSPELLRRNNEKFVANTIERMFLTQLLVLSSLVFSLVTMLWSYFIEIKILQTIVFGAAILLLLFVTASIFMSCLALRSMLRIYKNKTPA